MRANHWQYLSAVTTFLFLLILVETFTAELSAARGNSWDKFLNPNQRYETTQIKSPRKLKSPTKRSIPFTLHYLFVLDNSSAETQHLSHLSQFFHYSKEPIRNVSRLQALPAIVYKDDMFRAANKVCEKLKEQPTVVAMLGPNHDSLTAYLSSLSLKKKIPNFALTPTGEKNRDFTVSLFPPKSAVGAAVEDLLGAYKWQKFLLLYDDEAVPLYVASMDLKKLKALSKLRSLLADTVKCCTVKHAEGSDKAIFRVEQWTLRQILEKAKKDQYFKIIADLNLSMTKRLLRYALQLGMVGQNYQFVLVNLDTHLLPMTDYVNNWANMTTFRIVKNNPTSKAVLRKADEWEKKLREEGKFNQRVTQSYDEEMTSDGDDLVLPEVRFDTQFALAYDSLLLLHKALGDYSESRDIKKNRLDCSNGSVANTLSHGSSLLQFIEATTLEEGLTGNLQLDSKSRSNFSLDVLSLGPDGFRKIGAWRSEAPYDGSPMADKRLYLDPILMQQVRPRLIANNTLRVTTIGRPTFKVTTVLSEPYIFITNETSEGAYKINSTHYLKGFCIDLIKEIAENVGFAFNISLVGDGEYGSKLADGNWNGMVGELVNGTADLAIAPLTITYDREQAIDFTKPFMNLGISILHTVPHKEPTSLFSFMSPLAIEIWFYVTGAYMVVSLSIFVLGRFSPYEWRDEEDDDNEEEGDELTNSFTLSNSFWFTVGTLMQQGSDINPRAISTRIIGGTWWFFSLIIISSYTANLAAFLTVERTVAPIESAEDLANGKDIRYGTMAGGSTMKFFQSSEIDTYKKMWNYMESHSDVFKKSNEEGKAEVKGSEGKYAYLMESSSLDYFVQKECGLTQVGGLLDSKGYGLATRVGSTLRDTISMTILNLQENDKIMVLYNKWWNSATTCPGAGKSDGQAANVLGIKNIGGVFLILFAGLFLSFLLACGEYWWQLKKHGPQTHSHKDKSCCKRLISDLGFAMTCNEQKRRSVRQRTCEQCNALAGLGHASETGSTSSGGREQEQMAKFSSATGIANSAYGASSRSRARSGLRERGAGVPASPGTYPAGRSRKYSLNSLDDMEMMPPAPSRRPWLVAQQLPKSKTQDTGMRVTAL